MKASPAPSTLKTSIGKPRPTMPSSIRSGIAPGNTTQPIGPRFSTIVAAESERMRRSAASVSSSPAAMCISSSVPTIRSQSGSTGLEMLRHRVGADVALLAGGVAGEAPEVRPVVDVEDDLAPGGAGDAHRLPLRRGGVLAEKCVPVTTIAAGGAR